MLQDMVGMDKTVAEKVRQFVRQGGNRFGEGQAIYVAAGIGRHITLRESAEPWTKRLVANWARGLIPDSLYRADASPGVEVVFNRQRDPYVIHSR
jgi:hypothetical protein